MKFICIWYSLTHVSSSKRGIGTREAGGGVGPPNTLPLRLYFLYCSRLHPLCTWQLQFCWYTRLCKKYLQHRVCWRRKQSTQLIPMLGNLQGHVLVHPSSPALRNLQAPLVQLLLYPRAAVHMTEITTRYPNLAELPRNDLKRLKFLEKSRGGACPQTLLVECFYKFSPPPNEIASYAYE